MAGSGPLPPGTPSEADWDAGLDAVLADPGQPRLVVQPVADVVRGVVAGYEVLSRFDAAPSCGPQAWFAAAHARGCGVALEARVLARVLHELRRDVKPDRFLTVNLSPRLFFEQVVHQLLREAGDLTGLVLELTEHLPFGDLAELAARVAPWREAGAAVALDDAGSGYAGLQQLAVLRPEMVKLDISLVSGIDRDPVKLALAELLGSFAGRLDAWLLAEGVERREELDVLAGLGVPLVQGFLLGRPTEQMGELDPLVSGHLLARADARAGRERVGELLETAPTAGDEPSALHLLHLAPGSVVVVVDGQGVPRSLVVRGPSEAAVRPVALRVQASETTVDAVARAVTRPYASRLDPMVCVDDHGRLLGVVRVERAVLALTAGRAPT